MTIATKAPNRFEEQVEVARVLSARGDDAEMMTDGTNGSKLRQKAEQVRADVNSKRTNISDSTRVHLTVEFVDDQVKEFTFELPPDARLRFGQRIKEFLAQSSLAFQLPDRMLVIPTAQIKSLNFTPRPEIAPDGVFGNAQEVV